MRRERDLPTSTWMAFEVVGFLILTIALIVVSIAQLI